MHHAHQADKFLFPQGSLYCHRLDMVTLSVFCFQATRLLVRDDGVQVGQ